MEKVTLTDSELLFALQTMDYGPDCMPISGAPTKLIRDLLIAHWGVVVVSEESVLEAENQEYGPGAPYDNHSHEVQYSIPEGTPEDRVYYATGHERTRYAQESLSNFVEQASIDASEERLDSITARHCRGEE
jgi:hypothetical protein